MCAMVGVKNRKIYHPGGLVPSIHNLTYIPESYDARGKLITFKADQRLTKLLSRHLEAAQIGDLNPITDAIIFLRDLDLFPDIEIRDYDQVCKVLASRGGGARLFIKHPSVIDILHAFLQSATHLRASDDRDRIYALLGVAAHLAEIRLTRSHIYEESMYILPDHTSRCIHD